MAQVLPKIITRYDYENHEKPGVYFDPKKDKSLTNQGDLESTDINKIMSRYEKTGSITDLLGTSRQPMYGDFTEVKDYHTTLSAIRRTEQAFAQLPANVRNRFNNDPEALIKFLDDPKNDEEAGKLGLKEYKAPETQPEPKKEAPATLAGAPASGGAAEAAK